MMKSEILRKCLVSSWGFIHLQVPKKPESKSEAEGEEGSSSEGDDKTGKDARGRKGVLVTIRVSSPESQVSKC